MYWRSSATPPTVSSWPPTSPLGGWVSLLEPDRPWHGPSHGRYTRVQYRLDSYKPALGLRDARGKDSSNHTFVIRGNEDRMSLVDRRQCSYRPAKQAEY